jgi:hypothetical protein
MNRTAGIAMDRIMLLELWDESWSEGIWFGSWTKALDGLTAAQAAWRPQPGLHSIGQLVGHVAFWREYTLAKIGGQANPPADEVARRNFPDDASASEEAWRATQERLAASHRRIRDALANESVPLDRLRYHLAHDANHLGQILYLRRMQGLDPVE